MFPDSTQFWEWVKEDCIDWTYFCPQNSSRTSCKAQHRLEHAAWRKTLQLCISPGLSELSDGLLAPSSSHLSHLLSQLSMQICSLLSRNISETSLQLQWVKLRQEYAGDLRRWRGTTYPNLGCRLDSHVQMGSFTRHSRAYVDYLFLGRELDNETI